MKISGLKTNKGVYLNGPILLKPKIFRDQRGYFYESFNQKKFHELTKVSASFVQDNISYSHKGVLRGLHFQTSPKGQGKLIKVLGGEIIDVIVDLRKKSTTFQHWASIYLNNKNKIQLWIPEGFAHGFLTLSKNAIIEYKVTNYWSKKHEYSLKWNDALININWPIHEINNKEPIISEKDMQGKTMNELIDQDKIF